MAINFLKLNDEKTIFIMLGAQHDLMSVSERTVSVGSEEVLPSKTMRNIGVMMESTLTMKSHVSNITKSAYTQVRNLSRLRKYLSDESR